MSLEVVITMALRTEKPSLPSAEMIAHFTQHLVCVMHTVYL
jgi:hypothetical protein